MLTEDLKNLYEAISRNYNIDLSKILGPKGSSYRQWINTVKQYAHTHKTEKDFWVNVLEGLSSSQDRLSKLIIDASEDTNTQSCYSNLEFSVAQTTQLLRESNRAYYTQVNDLLLTALGYTLSEITGNRTSHIVLEGHGREEMDTTIDISRTLGWFTTMYPVRLRVEKDLGISIKFIKETLRQIPNKGIGFGVLLGYKPTLLPKINFNYLGQLDQVTHKSKKDTKFWNITNEVSGIAINLLNYDPNIINITGMVTDRKLQFSIVTKLGVGITTKIAKSFKQNLEAIITHTATQIGPSGPVSRNER